MHLEYKHLLVHDRLGRAKAQVQQRFRGSAPSEYVVLSIIAGTVGQFRPDTYQGSVQQPLQINYLVLFSGPLQDGRDAFNVQGVLGGILPNIQSLHMSLAYRA